MVSQLHQLTAAAEGCNAEAGITVPTLRICFYHSFFSASQCSSSSRLYQVHRIQLHPIENPSQAYAAMQHASVMLGLLLPTPVLILVSVLKPSRAHARLLQGQDRFIAVREAQIMPSTGCWLITRFHLTCAAAALLKVFQTLGQHLQILPICQFQQLLRGNRLHATCRTGSSAKREQRQNKTKQCKVVLGLTTNQTLITAALQHSI